MNNQPQFATQINCPNITGAAFAFSFTAAQAALGICFSASPDQACFHGIYNDFGSNGTVACSTGVLMSPGFNGDGTLNSTQFNTPLGMAAGPRNNTVVVADTGNNRVRLIDFGTNSVTTVAGNGQTFDSGDNGPATQASLYHPRGVAYDSLGNLFITTENGYVRKVDTTGVITTFAGRSQSNGGTIGENIPAVDSILIRPTGIVVDNNLGCIYVAESGSNVIRKIDFLTHTITTVAGNFTNGFAGDKGPALAASLSNPTWLGA